MDSKNNPDINWEAISALSNIAVALATFCAVIVSLLFAYNNIRSNTKIIQRNTGWDIGEKYNFRLVNQGFIPIKIIRTRVILYKICWKQRKKKVIMAKSKIDDLEQSDTTNLSIVMLSLNSKMLGLDFKPNTKYKLVVVFIDSREYIHSKKFDFVTQDLESIEEKMKPDLNQNLLIKIKNISFTSTRAYFLCQIFDEEPLKILDVI